MERPITLTIAALGGQGGGVVQNWMVDVAEQSGHVVQATSVPGVAQRTGATIYYLEFYPKSDDRPVMALMPARGTCDLVVASELVEAARMVQRRLVQPNVTTLITSTHRAYTIDEKSHLGDGRADSDELLEVVQGNAQRLVAFDMEAIAARHSSVISAAILGAIAGSGVLPFEIAHYANAIERSGLNVAANLAAFNDALESARAEGLPKAVCEQDAQPDRPTPITDGWVLQLPSAVREVVSHAVPRLIDYQDQAYVSEYRTLIDNLLEIDSAPFALTAETAKGLALWMTYEDTIRVADLKTKPKRLARLLGSDEKAEIVQVTEYLKPRIEEIAGSMPVGIGRWARQSNAARALLGLFTRGLTIRSSSLWGYFTLRMVARLRKLRRRLLRHHEEMTAMREWLDCVTALAQTDYDLAIEVARSQELVAGYGDTHERGSANLKRIMSFALDHKQSSGAHAVVGKVREAALADETGHGLDAAIIKGERELSTEAA